MPRRRTRTNSNLIYPFTFACTRDLDCLTMLVQSATKIMYPKLGRWAVHVDPGEEHLANTIDVAQIDVVLRQPGFSPWTEHSAVVKWDGFLRTALLREASDSDYVVHVDSDCIFYSPGVLDLLASTADIIGPLHAPPVQALGAPFSWCSGAFMALRVGALRDIASSMSVAQAQQTMRRQGLGPDPSGDSPTIHDDVVISFMFHMASARFRNAAPLARTGDLEAVVLGHEAPPSLLHYGTDTREFLGVKNCPKWKFPAAIDGLCPKKALTHVV